MSVSLKVLSYVPLLVSAMNSQLPTSKLASVHKNVDWNAEYETFATDALTYAFEHPALRSMELDFDKSGKIDEDENELGQFGTALMFSSLAYHESRNQWYFKKDGDAGASVCALQINASNEFRVKSGWKASDIRDDMSKCLDLGYKTLDWSYKKAGSANLMLKLTGYASGQYNKGKEAAFNRCHTFVKMFNHVVTEGEKGKLTLPIQMRALNQSTICGK